MKKLMTLIALSVALATPAFAASHKEAPMVAAAGASAPMSKQQSKMGTCNASAADKKGDERKAFMKECLSNKPMTQQDKMKSCNVDATGKKGDERKAFMKECLSK
jgi:predicted lipid-binding transport protein (Tim44 family)